MTHEERRWRHEARRQGIEVRKCLAEIKRHEAGVERMKKWLADGETHGFGVISRDYVERGLALHERGIVNNEAWAYASAVRAASYAHNSMTCDKPFGWKDPERS